MHVLESEQVAEHIPGCNMAFRREALEAVKGFDSQFKKAGDDVDLCWRLQHAGLWITFAPGAFVWHHRRQNPRAYLRQQAGYGEAEALLRFKHPEKFNGWGGGKWRGIMYGDSLRGLRFSDGIIYRGTFGTGLFQCLYQPGTAHWAMLPSTFEWHMAAALLALVALFSPYAWFGVALMLALTFGVAALQAIQARIAPEHNSIRSRLLIMALCYAQPLVRSWYRYRTRVFAPCPSVARSEIPNHPGKRLPITGSDTVAYWSEAGHDRTEVLALLIAYLTEYGWGKTIDSGWSDWDLEIYCHAWTVVQISTAQEEHGQGRRLIRVRYRLRTDGYTKILGGLFVFTSLLGVGCLAQSAVMESSLFFGACGVFGLLWSWLWWRGTCRAALAVGVVEAAAKDLSLIPLPRASRNEASAKPEQALSMANGQVKEGTSADETLAPGSDCEVVPAPVAES
jgi:hypothetical protein